MLFIHKVVWEAVNGPLPKGRQVLHRCDNPGCYRYDHLFEGDYQSNSDDCVAKGRRPRWKGEANAHAVLTDDQVREIRRRYSDGELQQPLAEEFGVNQTQISAIVRRKAWAHLA